ncbi:MAG: hypothetical protein HOC77_04910 [Chloroflexi bacterium]|jgi:hypothetical protein|nr:hypothetical protein [Chloroflexota bacterium]MBT4514418.1 hypothetical protein [Chloroflexota bacterium]MBT6681156.1 hypothetical protein [Chloroflexota bacterium]
MKVSVTASKALALIAIVATVAVACSSPETTEPGQFTVDPAASLVAPGVATDGSTQLVSEGDWVVDRLQTVQSIWGFSPDGVAWQNSYDFRQMRGQPAWFGSTGVDGWAGAGQAIPQSVLHELGHSYWGAFPVEGRPDSDTETLLQSYGADLLTFMRQPPDRFEPLRDRFRNLPNLDRGDLPDLVHFGESELIYFTGGDLDLVPPILRKYYAAYLTDLGVADDVNDWPAALGWWFALEDDERGAAGSVFGLQHFPLGSYEGVSQPDGVGLSTELVSLLESEEKQRLVDFADQFDEIKAQRNALTDATGTDRGFNFWARYLSDIFDLHIDHPEVLANRTGARGQELGRTLDMYREIESLSPEQQAERYQALIVTSAAQNVRDFAPLLKARALLTLFPEGSAEQAQGIEASASIFAAELRELVAIADAALEASKSDPVVAAIALAERLKEFPDDRLAGSIDTIFSTMRDADPDATRDVIGGLPDAFLLRLLDVRPSAARVGEITPERLLNAARVTNGASSHTLIDGVALLSENTSGNFAIDAPYDEAIYNLLDGLAVSDPQLVLQVFRETDLRPLPWVTAHGEAAARAFGANPASSAALLATYEGPEPTPERILRQLAFTDAGTAADLMLAALDVGRGHDLTNTLNSIVYDAYWSALGVGPDRRLESAAELLTALRDRVGAERVAGFVLGGVTDYLSAVGTGDLETEYRSRHIETIEALLAFADNNDDQLLFESLSAAIKSATS